MARICPVPGCGEPATRGEDWQPQPLGPIEAYAQGVRLEVRPVDIAVVLTLCDLHAGVLAAAGVAAVEQRLTEWGWRPLG